MIRRLSVAILLAVMYGALCCWSYVLLGLCRFSDIAWVLLAIICVSLLLPSVYSCCIQLYGCVGVTAVMFGFLMLHKYSDSQYSTSWHSLEYTKSRLMMISADNLINYCFYDDLQHDNTGRNVILNLGSQSPFETRGNYRIYGS